MIKVSPAFFNQPAFRQCSDSLFTKMARFTGWDRECSESPSPARYAVVRVRSEVSSEEENAGVPAASLIVTPARIKK